MEETKSDRAHVPKRSKDDIARENDTKYHFFFASKSPFSQWHPCEFKDNAGLKFLSAEQWMMYHKARLFSDHAVAEKIMATKDPRVVKELGRKVADFKFAVWMAECENIVFEGNMLKFTQNPELRAMLVATGSKILVEASPYDKIWGIGLSEKDARVTEQSEWPGTNLLGNVLTRVKTHLIIQDSMTVRGNLKGIRVVEDL